MCRAEEWRSELAARLARSVGSRAVVCIGCLPSAEGARLITLSGAPLEGTRVDLEQLVLVASFESKLAGIEEFASAGVPEVWLSEKEEGIITSLSDPRAGRYRRRSLIYPRERVRLVALPDVELTPLEPD